MKQHLESLGILHELHEPPTIGIIHGNEEVFLDTSDTGEGEHIPRSEPFAVYDVSTQQNVAPVSRSIRRIGLQPPVSAISHPTVDRIVKIIDFKSKIPLRNPSPAT